MTSSPTRCAEFGSTLLAIRSFNRFEVESIVRADSWYDSSRRSEARLKCPGSSEVSTMSAEAVPCPWRESLRFSVRRLIALVLVIGVGLGMLVRSARIQREAVAAIEAADGVVNYDWEWSNGRSIPGARPWAPKWLVDLIGVDYFGSVTRVAFHFPISVESDLVSVAARRSPRLESRVFATPSNDERISILENLRNLRELDVSYCFVTDGDLANVEALTSLRALRLAYNLHITDAGLLHLKGLSNLTRLDLANTKITDAGLVHLNGLTRLVELNLMSTDVTDAGLAHLKGFTKLAIVDLRVTRVTNAGVEELQRAFPRLKIIR